MIAAARLARVPPGNADTMQPHMSAQDKPDRALPIAKVTTGMSVADSTGEDVGTVVAVEMPGTDVPPQVHDQHVRPLMARGYLRVKDSGLLSADRYVHGGQIGSVATTGDDGTVELTVPKHDLLTAH
jgi:hypothetical protein